MHVENSSEQIYQILENRLKTAFPNGTWSLTGPDQWHLTLSICDLSLDPLSRLMKHKKLLSLFEDLFTEGKLHSLSIQTPKKTEPL